MYKNRIFNPRNVFNWKILLAISSVGLFSNIVLFSIRHYSQAQVERPQGTHRNWNLWQDSTSLAWSGDIVGQESLTYTDLKVLKESSLDCSGYIKQTKTLLRNNNISFQCSALDEENCDRTYQRWAVKETVIRKMFQSGCTRGPPRIVCWQGVSLASWIGRPFPRSPRRRGTSPLPTSWLSTQTPGRKT